jgi:hypothetical protein
MTRNIFQLIGVTAAFFTLLVALPYFVYGMHKQAGETLPKLFLTFCISSAQVAMSAYLLGFLNVFTPIVTYTLFLMEYIAIFVLVRRKNILQMISDAYRFVIMLNKGYYKLRVERKKRIDKLRLWFKAFYRKCVRGQTIWAILMVAAFGFGMYIRILPVVWNSPFGGNDLYTHTEWTKFMMMGDVYYRGVYPMGMHCVAAVMSVLFPINVVTVIRMIAIPYTFVMMLGVYFTIRALFPSRWAALAAMAVYACIFTVTFEAYWRHSFAFPQETSMVYWVIAVGAFIRLLRHPNADQTENLHLYTFCMALLGIVLVHPFSLMPAGIFCVIFFVVFIRKIFAERARLFKRLFVGVALAFVVGIVPLITGVALGKELDGSFEWGMETILGVSEEEGEAIPETEEAQEEQAIAAEPAPKAPLLERAKSYALGFYESAIAENLGGSYTHTFYAILATFPLFLLLIIRRKTRLNGLIILGYVIYNFIMFAFLNGIASGLPKLMTYDRAEQFYSVFECGLYAIPIQVLASIGGRARKALAFLASAAVLAFVYQFNGLKYAESFATANSLRAQWNGAVYAYYDIVYEYPADNWTIVSPVDEVSLTMGEGYHYELVDFIREMEAYNESMEITIPTQYVFFYVEKYPLNQEVLNDIEASSVPLSAEEAYESLVELPEVSYASLIYQDYSIRRIMEAKINLWCEVYARHFPDDISVVYEDRELKVYCLRQNVFAFSNLAIDYGGNSFDGKKAAPR